MLRSYEADTWYDRNGRIVFTNSRGLTGVGLPRTTKKGDPQPCWKDVQHMSMDAGYAGRDTVTQVVEDDTLPGGPREKTIHYQAPWIRCDRERDYEGVGAISSSASLPARPSSAMIPSALAGQLRQGLADFLGFSFWSSTPGMEGVVERLLAEPGAWSRDPTCP